LGDLHVIDISESVKKAEGPTFVALLIAQEYTKGLSVAPPIRMEAVISGLKKLAFFALKSNSAFVFPFS